MGVLNLPNINSNLGSKNPEAAAHVISPLLQMLMKNISERSDENRAVEAYNKTLPETTETDVQPGYSVGNTPTESYQEKFPILGSILNKPQEPKIESQPFDTAAISTRTVPSPNRLPKGTPLAVTQAYMAPKTAEQAIIEGKMNPETLDQLINYRSATMNPILAALKSGDMTKAHEMKNAITPDKNRETLTKEIDGRVKGWNEGTKRYDIDMGAAPIRGGASAVSPEYMNRLVDLFEQGKADPAKVVSKRVIQQLTSGAAKKYPNLDIQKAMVNYQQMARPDLIQRGTIIDQAYKTADLAKQYVAALNNGNIQLANKAANEWARQTGQPAPTNMRTMAIGLASELNRAYSTSNVPNQERWKAELQNLTEQNSPDQLIGSIETNLHMLDIAKQGVEKARQPYDWDEVRGIKKQIQTNTNLITDLNKKYPGLNLR